MPDRVGAGWRYGIRWTVVGVYRGGIYHYDFLVDRRRKGAFQG
jgi:hypothetical protein